MEKPFNKILIANRGEIAVRIIRTAKDMGIKTVAVYSDADRDSPHAFLADEKHYIGPSEPLKSYLNIEKIVEVAKKAEAEAVHPGYGFLSQNPQFARRLEEEGITFIGPPPEVQEKVGHKLKARKFFSSRGIPVVPGTLEPVSLEDAVEEAERIGYPVLIKPAGGGGGIGMSVAWSKDELERGLQRASQLAKSAFSVDEVYLEKYLPKAKHIEVQILGDLYGNIIHLFERECSVQRRYQKVIEETPSPAIDEEESKTLYDYAVKAAKESNYVNAGTFEFLFDLEERKFYLLEVNSRIQVEHPITEAITGVDIVKEQIKIAAGERLNLEVKRHGHAIEARVYAEDPLNGFAPSPGLITKLQMPSGPWIRVDSGVYEGTEVPPYYDPLIMKVVSWGRSREEARYRIIRALEETLIEGVKTNLGLLKEILSHHEFIKGSYTTSFLEKSNVVNRLRKEEKIIPRSVSRDTSKEKKLGVKSEFDAWKFSSRPWY
ncbi:MAG: acetyl-CoA carboxylase biotin carboxylase subunit [Thermoprotei archaeon]|nr:MAG: acetyl-CoA carboxylase biotin carboxylase subunit [Thermoprotei archaeon]